MRTIRCWKEKGLYEEPGLESRHCSNHARIKWHQTQELGSGDIPQGLSKDCDFIYGTSFVPRVCLIAPIQIFRIWGIPLMGLYPETMEDGVRPAIHLNIGEICPESDGNAWFNGDWIKILFIVVQSLSHVWLFATPWTTAVIIKSRQAK